MKWKKQHGNHSKMSLPFFFKSKARIDRDIVADLVKSCTTVGYYMSLQELFVDGHLHFSHKISGQ